MMKARLASRLLLHRFYSLCPYPQVEHAGGLRLAVPSPTSAGFFGGTTPALLPCPVSHWRNARSHSHAGAPCRSSKFQHYILSSRTVSYPKGCPTARNIDAWQTRYYSEDAVKPEQKRCWACHHEIPSGGGLFCAACQAIQPLDHSLDFFKIFDIPQTFKVDLKVLEQRYKDLQKKLHPDLAGAKSQREQGYSAEQSAHVIQAYYVLLRPLSRARYLLWLHGLKIEEEGTINDPELLMEIMEIRELLEEVSDAAELKQAQAQNHERILVCEKALEGAFEDQDLQRAVSWTQRLAYYVKVGEEVHRKL